MNRLERDAASRWHPFTQNSPWHGDRRTVITRIGGSVVAGGAPAAGGPKEPQLPPPNPDEPGGPSPTDPEGPTDPKPTEPTDPTGPDEPPTAGRVRATAGEVAG